MMELFNGQQQNNPKKRQAQLPQIPSFPSNKKQKVGKSPKIPGTIPKKDHFQRATYLYEIGSIMLTKQIFKGKTNSMKKKNKNKNKKHPHEKSFETLSRTYLKHMDLVSKKAVLKVHPDIKRTLCKDCSRLQVDGVTASTRLVNKSKNQLPHCDILEKQCTCGKLKRFPIGQNPTYALFSEKESVLYEPENRGKPVTQ